MNDTEIWHEIQAKGLTAPRVTLADIKEKIASEYYFTAADGVAGTEVAVIGAQNGGIFPKEETVVFEGAPLSLLTFCVLVLQNGFTVVGKSACASPENSNANLGRKVARDDALRQIWPLEGYLLKERLCGSSVAVEAVNLPENLVGIAASGNLKTFSFTYLNFQAKDNSSFRPYFVDGVIPKEGDVLELVCTSVKEVDGKLDSINIDLRVKPNIDADHP